MLEDTKPRVRDAVSTTVREGAEERAESVRRELGDVVVDATGQYFPEAVRRRRRRDVAGGFALGVLVGFAVRSALGGGR